MKDTVYFKQWLSTDRSQLETCQLEVSEFLDEPIDKFSELTAHPFIAQHKSQFVKEMKNAFLTEGLQYVSHKSPHVSKLFYFSNGCAGQYKNYEKLMNLLHHKEDFELDAEWHKFATSNGNNACDGVGGTIKRLAAYASLQHTMADQILTPQQLFECCENDITNIPSFFISGLGIDKNKSFLQQRYNGVKNIPGTWSYHSFVPMGS